MTYQKKKMTPFINMVQGSITMREYTNKFKDLYKYVKDIYPTKENKSEKFKDGLHVSLCGKLNLYVGTTFREQVQKAME